MYSISNYKRLSGSESKDRSWSENRADEIRANIFHNLIIGFALNFTCVARHSDQSNKFRSCLSKLPVSKTFTTIPVISDGVKIYYWTISPISRFLWEDNLFYEDCSCVLSRVNQVRLFVFRVGRQLLSRNIKLNLSINKFSFTNFFYSSKFI